MARNRQPQPDSDIKIAQLHAAGVSSKEIGVAFGITVQGVHAVLSRLRAEKEAIQRSAEFLANFRSIDDLDKKWTMEDLLNAMLLSTRAHTSIKNWCEWKKIHELSLRQLMDLVISEQPHAKMGFLMTPLLDLRNVRIKTFWDTVKRLTEADLGVRCNLEWRRRLGLLSRASRIVGGRPYSRSIPCEPPDWLCSRIEP